MFRLLFCGGVLLFTVEHPLFVALSTVFYLFSHVIKEEETQMLKDFAASGKNWIVKLNSFSRQNGMTMKEGREKVSDLAETFFHLSNEQLSSFLTNDVLKDRVNRFVVEELEVEKNPQDNWVSFILVEDDMIDEDYFSFINYFVPDFNLEEEYTPKRHRQLFKQLKSQFRNPDGSIKDELGNEAALFIEHNLNAACRDLEEIDYTDNIPLQKYLVLKQYERQSTTV